jgi:hypothetical protein
MTPVTLTLTFPDFTAASQALALLAGTPQAPGKSLPAAPAPGPRTAKVDVDAAPEKTAAASTPAAAPAAAKPQASTAAKAEKLEYETLRQAVLSLAKANATVARAINAELGVATMKDLPESRWQEALDKVNSAKAGLEKLGA